jgi:hypothetical protein
MEVPIFYLSYALLWILAVFMLAGSLALLYLVTSLNELIQREGSGMGNDMIGDRMPILLAKDAAAGVANDIREYQGQFHVVLALAPFCGTCRSLLKDLSSRPKQEELAAMNLLVLCMGPIESCKSAVSGIDHIPVFMTDQNDDSTKRLLNAGFPVALFVEKNGVVVDVRHPLTFEKLKSATETARALYRHANTEFAAPTTQTAGA